MLAALIGACGGAPANGPAEAVFLPPGAGFAETTDSLVAHHLVTNRRWFGVLARLGRYDRQVKAGYYELKQGLSPLDLLKILAAGTEKTTRFTVPEGFTVFDIAETAESTLGIPADSIKTAAADPALLREFGVEAPSLEGFLLPETYFVSRMITARGLVREMASLFRARWNPAWDERARAAGLSRLELVALASIVEGEARVDEDRPLVAAVYLNRRRIRMPLQADPTVQYAIQTATGRRKARLFERDYRFPSPFNTYLHAGLPPGPVGAPNTKSIEAVLDPAPVPFLYFVAGLDGKHVFSRTYGEHLRAIARIRTAERGRR